MRLDPNIQDNKNPLLKFAMHYGIFLGVFWAIKYLVFIAVDLWVHFIYFYYVLNVGTFLLIYIFYIRFVELSNVKSKFQGFKFVILLCFFASFFEAAIMYLHYQFLDPGYFAVKIEPTLIKMVDSLPYPPEMKAAALDFASSKILYVFSACMSNIFLGIFMGALMSFLVKKKDQ
ncbi:MAG: DUF4199 domain-containing protein [Dysgonomonas sp.]|nr:DUF4199 domain-containing protein [Dysgonomonas sp.]